jgi:CRP-like cAMP-binding protein
VKSLAPEPSAPSKGKIEQILTESPIFSSLSRAVIENIARASEKPFFFPGDFIVREGETSTEFYLILEGQVEANQRTMPLRRMGPGQFFGETSLTRGEPRTADVVATQPTYCLKIEGQRFSRLVKDNPGVAAKIMEEMIRRNSTIVKPATPLEGVSPAEERFDFHSDLARRIFEALVDSFANDYMVKRIVGEKCGWRSAGDIAHETGASVRVLYGKHGGVGPALAEPINRGLVESRLFPGERGRGGEVMRFRVAYETEPVKRYVNQKIRAGKKA